ncbi:hypothetical protein ACAN107058_23325 [Paracidovorax anthurii]
MPGIVAGGRGLRALGRLLRLDQDHRAGRIAHHAQRDGVDEALQRHAVRGRAQDHHAHAVAGGVAHQGLGHVARFEHVEARAVAREVQPRRPLAQPHEVAALQRGLAARAVGGAAVRGRDHGHAGQPRAGADAQRARGGFPQRLQRGVGRVLAGDGHHQDGRGLDEPRGQRAGLVVHAGRAQPAAQVGAHARAAQPVGTLGEGDLPGVGEVEGQVRGRGVALRGLGLQAAQDRLLQPGRQVGPVLARRARRHPQALAQAAARGGGAEGQLARGQLVEHHADREHVAAQVAAHAHHLLGCDPGGRAHGLAHLLGQQVGVVRVEREPEIQQHRAAVRAQQHVGGFQVEVAHVLLVQAMRSVRHGRAQPRDGVGIGPLAPVQQVLQRVALDVLHHEAGQPREVARGHEARHVRAVQRGQDLQLDLEAHDVLGAVARRHARHLHHQRKAGVARRVGAGHAVDVGHAARVQAFVHGESVHQGAGREQLHGAGAGVSALPPAGRRRRRAGRPRARRRRRRRGRRARGGR